MVQTPFTWRYGGHQVFLSASFNGWSERIPMGLIEGSATIFQKIVDLPPGCYQYKFLVDGAWKVDQHQVCVTDEYGIVNNVILVSETELMALDYISEASTSRINSRITPHEGSSSSSPLSEPVIQLPEVEMGFFRQILSAHLLSTTAYELIPISGKVATLDVNVDVEQAFHLMHEQGITVAPLWDESSGEMAGMLTASDFILILLQLQRNQTIFSNQELERQTVSSWKNWKLQHNREINRAPGPLQRRPLIHADPDESLGIVASKILQNNISAIPIIHYVHGSSPHLLHVACLAGILENVYRHFEHHLGYLSILQQPVGFFPLGTWAAHVRRSSSRPLLTLRPNDPLGCALALLLEDQISSVPIVDDMGNLMNIYSRSDITSLAKDNLYTRIQLNQMTILQALEVTGEVGRNRYQTCTRFDSLYRVMELLSKPAVRRVIVVEASSRRIEGVITLRDIFNFFLR